MDERSTLISLSPATSTRILRAIFGATMLLAAACGRAAGPTPVEDPPSRFAPVELAASIGELPTRDVKPPGDDTDEPPGELPVITIDDPSDDERRQ
jgi:hypothetical protein